MHDKILCQVYRLVLSQNKGILFKIIPKSLSCCFSHKVCAHKLPTIMYLASAIDKATHVFFLQCHEIKLEPSK